MILIKNANIVNEGRVFLGSVIVENGRIFKIIPQEEDFQFSIFNFQLEVDASGCLLLPGVIDTHVHFRDAGNGGTAAADFSTESQAAVAGGVTSVVDMPNTVPQTTSLELMEAKERRAAEVSMVNYGFMLGATNDNIDELLQIDPQRYAAIKLFLGSSTGNMLVNNDEALDKLFSQAKKLIVAHCESEEVIKKNLFQYKLQYETARQEGMSEEEILNSQFSILNLTGLHPKIRSTEACFLSTYHAIERALKYKTRLHIAHLTTATELSLFGCQPIEEKHITAEVTPNHLWFDDRDYSELGNLIKCNPAIKTNDDRLALWAALYDGLIDTIGSDHAPHPLEKKQLHYFDAPGGIPSIQHELQMMLEMAQAEEEWLPLIVEKMCHNPAKLFGIEERGFIREGYWGDLVLVRPGVEFPVRQEELRYKCGWSPLVGKTFHTQIEKTWVNGELAFDIDSDHDYDPNGKQLTFSK